MRWLGASPIAYAEQISVLSLAALRKLRFTSDADRHAAAARAPSEAESAARTALAALGVAAMAFQHEQDYDLRSRCLLVPEHEPTIELVSRTGGAPSVLRCRARMLRRCWPMPLLRRTMRAWDGPTDSARLVPSPKLCQTGSPSSRDQLRAVSADEVE